MNRLRWAVVGIVLGCLGTETSEACFGRRHGRECCPTIIWHCCPPMLAPIELAEPSGYRPMTPPAPQARFLPLEVFPVPAADFTEPPKPTLQPAPAVPAKPDA